MNIKKKTLVWAVFEQLSYKSIPRGRNTWMLDAKIQTTGSTAGIVWGNNETRLVSPTSQGSMLGKCFRVRSFMRMGHQYLCCRLHIYTHTQWEMLDGKRDEWKKYSCTVGKNLSMVSLGAAQNWNISLVNVSSSKNGLNERNQFFIFMYHAVSFRLYSSLNSGSFLWFTRCGYSKAMPVFGSSVRMKEYMDCPLWLRIFKC